LAIAIVTSTRFTSVATGAFGTARITFFTHLTRITRRHSTAVGERIFQTFLARFRSGQVLKIPRIAIQTIHSTNPIHVLTYVAIKTCFITRRILVLPFVARFTRR
jgi:hypothetical protein